MPQVATCLLKNEEGNILILKRSDRVSTYKGLWGGITGYVEKDEEPYDTAVKEIREEVGINVDELILVKKFDPIEFTDVYEDKKYDWKIYPFLFKLIKKGKINIDWEHVEYCWIKPSEIKNYDTVPLLKEIISELLL